MGLLLQPLPRGEQWVCKRRTKSAKQSCLDWGNLQGEPIKHDCLRVILLGERRGQSLRWRVKQAHACAWFGVGGEVYLQARRVVARGAAALRPLGMQGKSGYLTLASAGTVIRATDLKQAQCLKFRSQSDGDATGKRASGFPLAKWVLSYSTHLAFFGKADISRSSEDAIIESLNASLDVILWIYMYG